MSRDSLVFALSGTLFGLIVGWILGSQAADPRGGMVPAGVPSASAAPAASGRAGAPPARPIDPAKAVELERLANADASNAAVRVELGNMYLDADRPDLAIQWYQAALKINANDVDVSTDLAVSLYYANRVDEALTQIDRSLAIDPKHLKTLLNRGIMLAFGKNDLEAAAATWQRVIEIAPDSQEARRAKQGLDGIASQHGGAAGATPPASAGAGS
jgi:tetratricopeptide (TPR) repeat protein